MFIIGALVTATDLPVLLPLLQENIALNCDSSSTLVPQIYGERLEWGQELEQRHRNNYDIVVGADLLYVDEPVFTALLTTLRAVCG